ncbi:MAG: UDP-N-acetylglucosamine 2-epimerase, partial [Patescibacteria group bacterium]|nr:UDP-N-acetylglucosamine 2-epimerase [Patescibacteria group bacterium]
IEYFKSNITKLFHSSAPTDLGYQKRFLGRSRFFIYKHLFFLRTMRVLKMSRLEIFRMFLLLFIAYLGLRFHRDDIQFASTLLFLENESKIEPLVKRGFQRSSLIVVGNPTYDLIFQKLQKFKQSTKKSDKIRILMLTTDVSGQGGHWSKKRRDSMIKGIVQEIYKHKDSMSLVIKIHPSNESLSEYRDLINPIDPSISVYQEGDIVDLLENSDVVISSSTSTALVCALIAKKPIIIFNAFNIENDFFLERGLALECKDVSTLVTSIHQVLSPNPTTVKKIEKHIGEFVYKLDGRSCERVSNAIIELLKNQYRKPNLS